MFDAESLAFLEKFMMSNSPSGYEEEAAKVFREYLAGFCDSVETDVMGNTRGVLNENAPVRVMLAGHYDEIGFQVTYISEEGLLYIRPNGGIDKLNLPSSEVVILTEHGLVPGIIGKKPIHLLKPAERDTAIEISKLWIDIGAENKEEAEILAINDLLDTLKDNSYECDYKIVENYEDNVFYTVSRTGIVIWDYPQTHTPYRAVLTERGPVR